MKLSVSMLTSYMYCKRKLYLQYVLRLFEPIKEATTKGTIRHETYDLINKEEENIVRSINKKKNLEEIKELYKNKISKLLRKTIKKYKEDLLKLNIDLSELFRETWPLILEESYKRANNIFNFIKENNVFGDELWEKLTPKIKSEIKIESDELNLKGIIDQIEIYEDGIVPIELKTGSSPRQGVWPNHKVQIGAYAMLLKDKFKQDVKEGFIHYLDINQKRQIPINPFLVEEIKTLINSVNETLDSKNLPDFTTNTNKCNKCGLKEQCYDNKFLEKHRRELDKANGKL